MSKRIEMNTIIYYSFKMNDVHTYVFQIKHTIERERDRHQHNGYLFIYN